MDPDTIMVIRSKGIYRKKMRPGEVSKVVGVRLQPDILAALDAWIHAQPDPKPSRGEAMRALTAQKLVAD